jgi:cupin fold WbuC family metalloprotein
MPEVIKNSEGLLFVNPEVVAQVKEEALRSPRKMARLLMHLSHEDPVQEMLIAMGRNCAVTPNQSLGRSESLQVVEGELLIVVFDDTGKVTQRMEMAPPGSSKPFLYRFSSTPLHTMIPLTEMVVVHEALQGPFEESTKPLPDWVPGDSEALKQFLQEIVTQAGLL